MPVGAGASSGASIGRTIASASMEARVVVALALIVVAVVAAWLIERRRVDPPPQGGGPVPRQLDRNDFVRPDAPWLVVLFSSSTCDSCAAVAGKLPPLECDAVAVEEVEWSARRDLHDRYGVESVPLTLVADHEGVVGAAFLGNVTATDLWAAVAELREPNSSPEPSLGKLMP